MEKIFEGKVAIVTGGSFGIGRAAAVAFAARGAKVIVADWLEDKEQTTLNQIKAAGGQAIFIICDVSKSKDVQAMVEKTISTYGRLDYAFNNAGIEGATASTNECTEENWDKTININLKGTWLCMKHEIPYMLQQGKGAIVNCASVAGLIGFPGLPAYVVSKHGVVGLTKTAALENAKQHIRINAVCPGVIHTAMIDRITGMNKEAEKQFVSMEPVGRMGDPEEVAEAVIWLCSDAASFVTGHAMPVDGGWIAG
ncbi:short-chain dehydrogenase [Niastella vici]|uniref:Short-chain dehydrogenase n=1 Tax=Niastella vici TaxID=1703345 RepID=A0A1V9FZY8_9BACT|nr:SDR family oxidoreductase [Niastella vici]OQP63935.1 short-chain dehydrogenase [Niastella vici]